MKKTNETPYLVEAHELLDSSRTDKREKIKSIVQSYSDAEYEWGEYNHPKPNIDRWVDLIMEVFDGEISKGKR